MQIASYFGWHVSTTHGIVGGMVGFGIVVGGVEAIGMPVSTTHTLVGAVIGVGLARGIGALDLSMTRDIVVSWIVTVPVCGAITVACYYILAAIFGI